MTSPATTTIPFTPEAFAQLQADLERLNQEQKEILIRLQTAREMGDLSENGAYHAAKFELGSIRRQLSKVKHLLANGQVVHKQKSDMIGFGSQVSVSDGNRTTIFTLVSLHESDPSQHKLSIESPLGQALLGKKAGDQIIFQAPRGEVNYHVLKVE